MNSDYSGTTPPPEAATHPTCGYPHCQRPTAVGAGTGRPPLYCEDPEHHKVSAWRERRRLQLLVREVLLDAPGSGEAHAARLDRPLITSHASLTRVVEGLRAQILTLTGDLHVALDDLRVVGDPDAAAAEVATITEASRQQVTESVALAVRAEAARLHAEQLAAEADAAAVEATRTAHALSEELTQTRAALDAANDAIGDLTRQHEAALAALAEERRTGETRLADQRRLYADHLTDVLATGHHLRTVPTPA